MKSLVPTPYCIPATDAKTNAAQTTNIDKRIMSHEIGSKILMMLVEGNNFCGGLEIQDTKKSPTGCEYSIAVALLTVYPSTPIPISHSPFAT